MRRLRKLSLELNKIWFEAAGQEKPMPMKVPSQDRNSMSNVEPALSLSYFKLAWRICSFDYDNREFKGIPLQAENRQNCDSHQVSTV